MTITQDPPGDISEGQDVTLSCFAPANPPAQVKWFQNGHEMTMTNSSSITLQNVAHASNGNYTCLAQNDGFEAVRLIYGLSVRCKTLRKLSLESRKELQLFLVNFPWS